MKHLIARASTLALLAVSLVASGYAQQPSKNLSQGAAPPPKGALPPGVSKDEIKDYKAIYDARTGDDAKIIMLGEAFVMKYPMSMYIYGVYSQLTNAYLHTGQTDKMFDVGNKALALNPDSIDVLPVLAWAIPRSVNSKTPDGPAQLQKAEGYAHHGIELLNATVKPAGMDDAAFNAAKNEKLSMCYSGLGTADVKTGKYDSAAMELDQAVTLVPMPDSVDLYLLGLADEMSNHFTKSIAAYTKCTADQQGPMLNACKSGIDEAKKKASNSIEAP